MVLSSRSGLWGAFPTPIRGRHLFLFSGEEKQERADSAFFPLCLSGVWPFPPGLCLLMPHVSHSIPVPPFLMTTSSLPFSSSLILNYSPFPASIWDNKGAWGAHRHHTSSTHMLLHSFPTENTGRFTQQFNVTVLPFLLLVIECL